MHIVMVVATVLAILLGQSFTVDWKCHTFLYSHTPYVCEYSGPQPLHIFVWSNDGREVHTSIDSLGNGQ